MTESKDPPIEPQDYTMGPTVVDIGDLRVARGMSRRPHSSCKHTRLHYDPRERRIWCPDCETNIEPFDAFEKIVGNFDNARKRIDRDRAEVDESIKHNLISIAAKVLDKIWRGRRMVPACPCCGHGLFPEDFKNGISASLGREYATARRKQQNRPVPPV